MIRYSTFIHPDPGHAKLINLEKMKQKKEKSETEPEQKRVVNHTFDINFIA